MVLFACTAATWQVGSLEKHAVESVQRTFVSKLDADLPNTPFRAWFSQLVGPEAVVVWQLTECGEHEDRPATTDQDQTA
ncbi:MAG TPA: hypothetical protein VJ302_34535, partial [Blastocatellia bacterium]|nr:hypothetical protein [Blastocatellia bacterium]